MRNKRKENKEKIKASLLFYAGETTIGAKELKGVQWDSETTPKST